MEGGREREGGREGGEGGGGREGREGGREVGKDGGREGVMPVIHIIIVTQQIHCPFHYKI